jgi:hypothetical protein
MPTHSASAPSSVSHPLIEKFQRAGQDQVFAFFDQLSPEERRQLLDQAAEIDLGEIERLSRTLLAKDATAGVDLAGLGGGGGGERRGNTVATPRRGPGPGLPARRRCAPAGWQPLPWPAARAPGSGTTDPRVRSR